MLPTKTSFARKSTWDLYDRTASYPGLLNTFVTTRTIQHQRPLLIRPFTRVSRVRNVVGLTVCIFVYCLVGFRVL